MTKQTTVVVIGSLMIKEEYLVIILGYFFLFLYKSKCCGYSLELSQDWNNFQQHFFVFFRVSLIFINKTRTGTFKKNNKHLCCFLIFSLFN